MTHDNTETLTGATRLRADTTAVGLAVLVLQVETRYLDGPHSMSDEFEWVFGWRDAAIEDLTASNQPMHRDDMNYRRKP